MITDLKQNPQNKIKNNEKEGDCLSDSPPRKKMRSSKKQRISQMKDKMRVILAKVQQLQKQKVQDRQQLQKLMGNSLHIQQLTVRRVQKCQEMRTSSLTKSLNKSKSNSLIINALSQSKNLQRCTSVKKIRADLSYIRTKPLEFKKVKREKVRLHKQTVKNFTFAVLMGVLLILIIKFSSNYSSNL